MATLPIDIDSKGFTSGIADAKRGLTAILGPLNAVTARLGLLQAGAIGAGIALGLGLAFGAVKAVKAIIDLNVHLIKLDANAREIESRFDVVFGDSAGRASDQLGLLAAATGRYSVGLKEGASQTQQFGVSLGFTRDAMSSASVELAALAIDFASLTNKTDTDVLSRFNSALVGNSEAVRELGINLKEGAVQAFALESGIIATDRQLNEQEKVVARLGLLFKSSNDALVDSIATQDELVNQARRVTGAFQEMKRVVAQDVGDSFRELTAELGGADTAIALLRVSMKALGDVAELAFVTIDVGSLVFGQLIRNMTGVEAIIDNVAQAFGILVDKEKITRLSAQILRLGGSTASVQASLGQTRDAMSENSTEAEILATQVFQLQKVYEVFLEKVRTGELVPRGQQNALDPLIGQITVVGDRLKEAKLEAQRLLDGFLTLGPVTALRTGFEGISQAIGDAAVGLSDFGETAQRVFQQMISDLIAATTRAFLFRAVISPLLGGASGSGFGALVAQQLGFRVAAKGMVEPFQGGGFPTGMINSPTMFGLAGEKGREVGFSGRGGNAIAPLETDPASGALGIRVVGGGGQAVSFNNTFVMSGSNNGGRSDARMSARQVELQLRGVMQRV